ncbi:MAG: S8 family peptidase [Magnetococcales bacterium]|nr:S8 family peptidase [Magnetococcales bacterium]
MEKEPRQHLLLSGYAKTEKFRSPSSPQSSGPSRQVDRVRHGQALMSQISTLKEYASSVRRDQEASGYEIDFGIRIQFRSPPDIELAFESLSRERQGIELLNVKRDGDVTCATVFVPDGKIDVFEGLIRDYMEKNTAPSRKYPEGHPKNQNLVETIQEIRESAFDSLWTDTPDAMPRTDDELIWWEIWLPLRGDGDATLRRFKTLAISIGFEVAQGSLRFLERIVLLMRGSKRQITRSLMLLNSIAELRRAKETAEFFDSLTPQDQHEWVDDLLNRTFFPAGDDIPHICLLDTGVNRGHPLLKSTLNAADLHTLEPAWGVADEAGHGTELAGLSLFGDLTSVLETKDPIQVHHRLESVKLLRDDGDNDGRHHGHLTVEAVARPEIQAAHRRRVFSMAVTAKDNRDRGKPSAWSAAIDHLAADTQNNGLTPRLMVVSSGNVRENSAWGEYPNSNTIDSIHDPGQAWNAITVGAYTEKVRITENAREYQPIAPPGAISPFSTTSMTWEKPWPLKPDVVLEGGNVARDTLGAVWMPSLSLLTTHHKPEERLLSTTNATSAATALCARMAAQLMAAYPNFWPETIRAMIVHSALWTEAMRRMFMTGGTPKEQYRRLIRHCGFGVPNLAQAMWSVSNSLTLIAQDDLQPFEKIGNAVPSSRDMNLYELPWPISELERLGSTAVEMRVTLSYFIEPNPAERGFKGRYKYESHGLRFQVKRPTETIEDFRSRVNRLARDEEEGATTGATDPGWLLGPQLRHLGSLHSDIWRGEAVKLAQLGVLAVFPALGWWKTRTGLERYHNKARYALVVSIHAPEVEVDLYNVVRNEIIAKIAIVT